MARLVGRLTPVQTVSGALSGGLTASGNLSVPKNIGTSDYNELYNRPSINGVLLVGNRDIVLTGTTAEWESNRDYVGENGVIYVYTDHQKLMDDVGNITYIPGIKIGDGNAYLIDTPFIDACMIRHMDDLSIHVTPEEKEFWNNKDRAYVSEVDTETLIFTKE